MANCGVCKAPCNETTDVKCTGVCNGIFHLECVKSDTEGRKTRLTRDWKCKSCKQRAPSTQGSGVSSETTATLTKEFLVRVLEEFKNEVFGELSLFRREMSELSSSMQFLSDKVDSANNLMAEIKTELAVIKKENEELRNNNTVINKQVSELQDRIRNLEQYSRRNNVEISGIPTTANEDVRTIIQDVGAAIGLQVQQGDVVATHRIPTYRKDRIPSVVVQFRDRVLRDTWISKFKEMKTLTAYQINHHFSQNQRVYVNEHQSPDNKLFLSTLKKKCREINYAFVWCREGKFFIRKSEGGKVQRVTAFGDIDKLK